MLTPPALAAETIIASVRESYALRIYRVTFLPVGADANTAVYRVDADDGAPYFLKLRRADFDDVSVAVPAFLHAQGLRQVMAPLTTTMQSLWVTGHGFTWVLYPYLEGVNAFQARLSDAQWVALGQTMRGVHATELPPALARRVPREMYSPRWRDAVKVYQRQFEMSTHSDPVAARLAEFWIAQRGVIDVLVERAQALSRAVQRRDDDQALCHSDLHGGNVLLSGDDEVAIVDWDNPILAPKERDLMFVGGGLGFVQETAHTEAMFYQGYGPGTVDMVALAYYRYERIVVDLAVYADEILGVRESLEDRQRGLRQVMMQFLPNNVVNFAHRTYLQLP